MVFWDRQFFAVFDPCDGSLAGSVAGMSCIRFNTPAQRQAMRDYRPTMLVPGEATGSHPTPPVTATKIARLRLLATSHNPKIRESVASSHNTPDDLFVVLARDSDDGVRSCIARNEHTPCDVLRSLVEDSSERVRGFLALNFFVPADVMTRLADDQSETVRGLVSWKRDLVDAH